jgi:MOSC domain-containing protein YiiM
MIHTTVAALFIHGDRSSRPEDTAPTPMLSIGEVEAVEECGLRQDARYFTAGDPGRERKRQVSLIDESTIRRHEAFFGPIPWNTIKAQIVLEGDVPLAELIGATLTFESGAELTIAIHREPCFAMDLIAPGLREAMKGGHQGALARVTASGVIAVGMPVAVTPAAEPVEAGR